MTHEERLVQRWKDEEAKRAVYRREFREWANKNRGKYPKTEIVDAFECDTVILEPSLSGL